MHGQEFRLAWFERAEAGHHASGEQHRCQVICCIDMVLLLTMNASYISFFVAKALGPKGCAKFVGLFPGPGAAPLVCKHYFLTVLGNLLASVSISISALTFPHACAAAWKGQDPALAQLGPRAMSVGTRIMLATYLIITVGAWES